MKIGILAVMDKEVALVVQLLKDRKEVEVD